MSSARPPPPDHGLLSSVRSLLGAVVSLLGTRLQLASTELHEEWLRLVALFLWAVAALFCLGLAVILLAMLLVLLAWNGPREAVLGALALAFLAAGGWASLVWRRKANNKPALLADTIAELRRDSAALGRRPL